MSFKVAIALVTVAMSVPITDVAAGNYRAQLLSAGAVVHAQDAADPEFLLTGVAEGSYDVTVCRLNIDGAIIGTPFSQALVVAAVPPEMADVQVPSGMTVTFTPE